MMLSNDGYNMLSEKEKYYYQQIEYHSSEIPLLSIIELSEKIYTSPASLSRLVKKLGYKNYKDFKNSFITHPIKQSDNSMHNHVYYLFENIPEIIEYSVADYIDKAASIYIVAFGNSKGVAQELALTLSSKGKIVFKIFDSDFVAQVMSNIKSEDIVIYISYGGNDIYMQKLAISLKNKYKQILITSTMNNPLSLSMSFVLNTHTDELRLAYTTRLPLAVVVNIICSII